jgi:lysophospholipase L1-like esterase
VPRVPKILRKLSLSAASLAVVVVSAELVLRAQEPGPFSLVDRNPYVASPADGHVRHRPNFAGRWDSTWYATDSRGFRGPERTPTDAEGELRVACLGDSCTFGKGVREVESWPRRLESMLRARGRDALVFNLGVNGGDGLVYRTILSEHVAELRPHAIVVGYNINDFPNTIRAVDEKVFKDRPMRRLVPKGVRDLLGRTALFRKVRAAYYDAKKRSDWKAANGVARATAGISMDEEVWREQRQHLAAIRDLGREYGAPTIVVLFPYESQLFLEHYDRAPIERLRATCDELGLAFRDLAAEFRAVAVETSPPRQLFLAGDRYHPNAAGYEIVARRVAEELAASGATGTR